MTDRIKLLLDNCNRKAQHIHRARFDRSKVKQYRESKDSLYKRTAARLVILLDSETPVVAPEQKIVLQRTITDVPGIFSDEELHKLKAEHYIHELGNLSNICPNYISVIEMGFGALRNRINTRLSQCIEDKDAEGIELLTAMLTELDAVSDLCRRYREKALEVGNTVVAEILDNVPERPAKSFHEALQFFRILHYTLWAEGEYHNTVGRFDQYMFPYLSRDLQMGVLTQAEGLELLEEFFISFNIDSDIYPGVQQGDDGQSMMLGGVDADGNDSFNLLSEMCLTASRELLLIDPKINLRMNKNTPIERYNKATLLTKAGLGFPQYSNDDVVIPGLLEKGYSLKDARDYTVAACWEFIIPGYGMDVVNIGALSFAKVIDRAMNKYLTSCNTFDLFLNRVKEEIYLECDELCAGLKGLYIFPAPFMSILMNGCIEKARDISLGCKYNNFGIHGTGIANGADSLMAIKQYVFDEKSVDPVELLMAINADFEGYPLLRAKLRYEAPKMGCDNDAVDELAGFLLQEFANALQNRTNERGGCYRAGTGSAMYYIWHAREVPAGADGRSSKEPLGANFSPNLFAKVKGPMSVIRSFTKNDLTKTINGGPLTLEFHSTLFDTQEGIEKVAALVKAFIDMGGHQLQLNAINRDVLLRAQAEPENYKNLIVRVWGWSAYFCELDKEYQEHLIRRQEYGSDC